MESFKVKILQNRKRLGIKEISAPSLDIAECSLIEILSNYFKSAFPELIYLSKERDEIKMKMILKDTKLSIHIYRP